jgi:hypothetical protein
VKNFLHTAIIILTYDVTPKNRSSDSAKYTNKSSGTSVLSTNANSFHAKFYNKGTRHHENERQLHGKQPSTIAAVPVHKKFVPNSGQCESSNHFINRFINTAQYGSNNNHHSLSLNRHTPNHSANYGVGGTLTSPYAISFGNGHAEAKSKGSKSDIGIPISSRLAMINAMQAPVYNSPHSKPAQQLLSVQSELSIYDATFKDTHPNLPDGHKDILNNNSKMCRQHTPMTGTFDSNAMMSSLSSKTGSKLLYSNRHRLDSSKYEINNNVRNTNPSALPRNGTGSFQGPLVYKNSVDDLMHCDSVFDNPIMSVS